MPLAKIRCKHSTRDKRCTLDAAFSSCICTFYPVCSSLSARVNRPWHNYSKESYHTGGSLEFDEKLSATKFITSHAVLSRNDCSYSNSMQHAFYYVRYLLLHVRRCLIITRYFIFSHVVVDVYDLLAYIAVESRFRGE